MPQIKIAPSILASDFSRGAETVIALEKSGADYVHCDIMDGNFVPPITFGHQFVGSLRPHTSLPLDCHLMVLHPETHFEELKKAGADIVTIHREVCKERTPEMLRRIRSMGMKSGAVVNPDTPIEQVFDCIEDADMVLIMSVFPGWGGQKFIADTLKKAETLRAFCIRNGKPDFDIEMDGGISAQNAKDVISAGVNVLVAGSAVFRAPNMAEMIRALRG